MSNPMLATLWLLIPSAALAANDFEKVKGSGESATETRKVATFDAVRFQTYGEVEITIGAKRSLEITADDNVLPLFETKVINDQLVIRSTKGFKAKVKPVFKITTPNLRAVKLDGAGDVTIMGVDNDSLTLALNGAGKIIVSGETKQLAVKISGAGDVVADELVARAAKVEIPGTGKVSVHVQERLDATVSGVGTVKYSGSPTVNAKVTGIGKITK